MKSKEKAQDKERKARDKALHAFAVSIGVAFNDLSLLDRALTHDSYVNEHPGEPIDDNERLEFLGDAVLDFLAADWLYDRLPDEAEGKLTQLRTALVRNETLAGIASRLGIGMMLLMGRGEAEHGGRKRARNLGGALEAILGALYLDSGMDAARGFIAPHFEAMLGTVLHQETDKDAKARLLEWSQKNLGLETIYRDLEISGPQHEPVIVMEVRIGDEVYGTGSGRSKREASHAAAHAALAALRERGIDV